jgi:hypothetical protein
VSRYMSTVSDTGRRRYRVSVSGYDSVHFVAARIVSLVPSAVAAR